MKGAGERPKCKELSKAIFAKSKSSFPNGGVVGLGDGDKAVLLQAIDSSSSLDPNDSAPIRIGGQEAAARKAIGGCKFLNLVIPDSAETVTIGNPQGAVTGRQDCHCDVVLPLVLF